MTRRQAATIVARIKPRASELEPRQRPPTAYERMMFRVVTEIAEERRRLAAEHRQGFERILGWDYPVAWDGLVREQVAHRGCGSV